MRDLGEHPSAELTLDFSKADFGGPRHAAVVEDGRAGLVVADAANECLATGRMVRVGA